MFVGVGDVVPNQLRMGDLPSLPRHKVGFELCNNSLLALTVMEVHAGVNRSQLDCRRVAFQSSVESFCVTDGPCE